jgi:UDP-N-acetylglucosamine 2-epimerase (non-hydrolysing)
LKKNRIDILFVFGTRPEAIKVAPVFNLLKDTSDFRCEVCITAQHRQMLDQVLNIFKIKPNYDLDLMQDNQDLFSITSNVLNKLKSLIQKVNPRLIVVQGDTTTAFAVSLAAFYMNVPIAHIEAGLRTYNKTSPFPEEINRRMISVLADLHFAPTEWAKNNLIKEQIKPSKVFITGNTVIDALCNISREAEKLEVLSKLQKKFYFLNEAKRMILITGHRRESFGEGFENICLAIRKLAEDFPDDNFVYPVHLNPNVQAPVQKILNHNKLPNLFLIEPLDYLFFVGLMKESYFILTDSGGIQEEAISFNKPTLVMRNVTERPEGVEIGAVNLVGNNKNKIVSSCRELLLDNNKYASMCEKGNPYGDGRASQRIGQIISEYLGGRNGQCK